MAYKVLASSGGPKSIERRGAPEVCGESLCVGPDNLASSPPTTQPTPRRVRPLECSTQVPSLLRVTNWPQTVSFPGYGGARRRRSTSIGEAVRDAEQPDAATAVLAFAVLAARSTDQDTITVPAHDDTHWRAITVDLAPGTATASLHQVVTEQLAGPPVSRPPPPNRAVVVLGDHLVDGSHVALRIRPDGIELEGPVEPTDGISVLAQRLSWLIEMVSVDRAIDTIAPIPPDERARTLSQRSGADLRPIRHVLTEIERTTRAAPRTHPPSRRRGPR